MNNTIFKTAFKKDLTAKKIFVTREFAAPVEQVWQAWTDSNILDQWWAPKPWKAETKTLDFREGGSWLYSMVGPAGERHWSKADYKKIIKNQLYEGEDYFCDENGKKSHELPGMHWKVQFSSKDNGTKVDIEITFSKVEDLETIVKMGFQEGFSAAHNNLDELLAK